MTPEEMSAHEEHLRARIYAAIDIGVAERALLLAAERVRDGAAKQTLFDPVDEYRCAKKAMEALNGR